MKQTKIALINPKLLKWAREQCGLTLDKASEGIINPNKLRIAEEGGLYLTFRELIKLAERYERPPAFFYLKEIPRDKTLNFSHKYAKLEGRIYTTIRKRKIANIGDIIAINIRKRFDHYAKVLNIERVKLSNLPDSILLLDCFCNNNIKTREDCYKLFQSFYRNIIDFEKQTWYLYLLLKCD